MARGIFVILADEPDGLAAKEALARMVKTVLSTSFETAPPTFLYGWCEPKLRTGR